MAFSLLITSPSMSGHEVALTRLCRYPSRSHGNINLDCGFNGSLRKTNQRFALSTRAERLANGPEDSRIFENFMVEKVRQINKALELAVPLGQPLRIHKSMRYTLLGNGKRVPGMLCFMSSELVGGEESRAMTAACALEMVHAMSLIHDDLPCMDDDDFRRGMPTNHRAFDEGTALLAADALFALAFEHMAGMKDVPACRVLRVISEVGRAAGPEGILGGQLLDMLYEGRNDFSLSELEYIHTHKANIMSAATVCGAIVGGGDEDEIEKMRELGSKLGLLYQAVDDILDVTGSSEELGKKAGRDLKNDKATFPKLMGIDGAKRYASELLDDVLQDLSWFDYERSALIRQLVKFFVSRRK